MAESSNRSEQPVNIRQLVNECQVALRLEQHYKVSSICLHMSKLLVELYDRELLAQEEEEEVEEDDEDFDDEDDEDANRNGQTNERFFKPEWNLISAKCRQLRHCSQLAETYGDVLEFVRVRDLVCLGELVGANKKPERHERHVKLDIELLSRTFRQCVLLLKQLSGSSPQCPARDNVWLSTDRITRIRTVGFPRHLIDLADGSMRKPVEEGMSSSSENEDFELESSPSLVVTEILRASWFEQFWRECMHAGSYPLDRLPILVALWIIASECQHGALEHLMSELVDQIYHQEANSCHQDELMQLTQVGAFWLSHKKRFSPTMKHPSDQVNLEDDLEDDEEEGPGRPPDDLETTSATTTRANRSKFLDFRPLLRAMIDGELLVGQPCVLCSREPSGDPLEPVHLSACPRCSLDFWPHSSLGAFCCLSLQPIQWLSLANLLGALAKLFDAAPGQASRVARLLVLTPNEYAQTWLRAAVSVDKKLFARASEESDTSGNGTDNYREHYEVSDRFQRLRVLRNVDSGHKSPSSPEEEDRSSTGSSTAGDPRGRQSSATDDDEDEEEFENFSQDGAQDKTPPGEEEEEADKRARSLESCLADLSTFLETRFRLVQLSRAGGDSQRQRERELDASQQVTGANYLAQWLQLSETLQLMKLAFRHGGGGGAGSTTAAVYSGDLVALDALYDERLPKARSRRYVSLYLVARKPRPVPPTSQANDKSTTAAAATGGGHYLASGICGTSQPVYACLARSRTSALQLGCGRLFNPLELIRVGCHAGRPATVDSPAGARFRSRRLVKYLHWPRLPTTGADTHATSGPTCPACRCQLVALRPGYLSH